jgi:hypothetical protein
MKYILRNKFDARTVIVDGPDSPEEALKLAHSCTYHDCGVQKREVDNVKHWNWEVATEEAVRLIRERNKPFQEAFQKRQEAYEQSLNQG